MTRDSEKTAQADFPERREEARGLVKGGETRSEGEGEDANAAGRGGGGDGGGAGLSAGAWGATWPGAPGWARHPCSSVV